MEIMEQLACKYASFAFLLCDLFCLCDFILLGEVFGVRKNKESPVFRNKLNCTQANAGAKVEPHTP